MSYSTAEGEQKLIKLFYTQPRHSARAAIQLKQPAGRQVNSNRWRKKTLSTLFIFHYLTDFKHETLREKQHQQQKRQQQRQQLKAMTATIFHPSISIS